jgi:hypothetical protein
MLPGKDKERTRWLRVVGKPFGAYVPETAQAARNDDALRAS